MREITKTENLIKGFLKIFLFKNKILTTPVKELTSHFKQHLPMRNIKS